MSKIEREKYLKEMLPLFDKKISKKIDNSKIIRIGFTKRDNKHLFSDTFVKKRRFKKFRQGIR